MRILGGTVVVAMLLLSGCTGGDEAPPARSTSPLDRDDTTATTAWTLEEDVLGQPAIEGDVAIAIVQAPGRALNIIGIDTDDGTERWRHPYSPGGAPSGFRIEPKVFTSASGTKVTAWFAAPSPLRPSETQWRQPVVVTDIATGKELFRTTPFIGASPLRPCDDDIDICVDGSNEPVQRINIDDQTRSDDRSTLPDDARFIGDDGLFATDARPGEKIGVSRDGATLWSQDINDFADGQHVSTDLGWSFDHFENKDWYTGNLIDLDVATIDQTRPWKSDVASRIALGFDGATGEVAWRERGVELDCLFSVDSTVPGQRPVRCRYVGSVIVNPQGDPDTSGVQGSVEGYDRHTGKTTWSLNLTAPQTTALITGSQAIVGEQITVVETTEGRLVVDTASGRHRTPTADEVFACVKTVDEVPYALPRYIEGRASYDRLGDAIHTACHADGTPAPTFTAASLRDTGIEPTKAGVTVVAGDGKLTGYTVSD